MKKSLFIILFVSAMTLPFYGQSLKIQAEKVITNQFKENVTLSFEKFKLTESVKNEISSKYGQKFFRDEIYHWKVFSGDTLIAHAFLDNVLGKTQPITFLVIISKDGKILYNSIIKYRSDKGGAVQNRSWLDQFIGRDIKSEYKVGKDIQALSGATYSVRSLTIGFQKILALYNKVFKLVN